MLKVTLSTFVELVFLYSDNKLKKKVGRGGVVSGRCSAGPSADDGKRL